MLLQRLNNDFSELIMELKKNGLEEISETMIAPLSNDSKKVLIEGVYFTNNIHYSQEDIFFVKGKTEYKKYYVRSDGDKSTNLLLYSHVKELIKDNLSGVFSIGSALNNKKEEITLCICQIIDYSKLDQIQNVFTKQGVVFKKFENKYFLIDSAIIFAYL
jgi:hypothetical protein